MKRNEKVRLYIICGLGIAFICVVGFFIYNYFIKIAPVGNYGPLVYKGNIYRECFFYHENWELYKCLGQISGTTSSLYTVKGDPDNDFLIEDGFLYRNYFVKENIYEQHHEQDYSG